MTEPRDLEMIITETARAVTARELRASLRPAVLNRLDERRRSHRSWWLPVSAVAAAAAVTTVMLLDRRHQVLAPVPPPEVAARSSAEHLPVIETTNSQAAPDLAIGAREHAAHRDVTAWRDQLLPQLPSMPALELPNSRIQPAALGIAQLDVQAIGVAPLVVAPIDGSMPR